MTNRMDRRLGGRRQTVWLLVLGLLLSATAGCSRALYRNRADCEAYALIDRGAAETDSSLECFSIEPQPESRMYDPNCPDCPPMPPDDPTSHRLMQCVDCKRGWPGWGRNGTTPFVENPAWRLHLPYDESGQLVLDRDGAVRMALLHSREYQQELENLYVSALAVTLERFRFDTQFFGGNSTFFTADGPLSGIGTSSSQLQTDTKPEMNRLLATGGNLAVDVANSVVWQFTGADGYNVSVPLHFLFTQPLLRAASRAVVLENLTTTERRFLADIRSLERFRRIFYTQIAIDYLALLENQLQIRNQRGNVEGLVNSLEQLEALNEVGRMSSYDVNLTRQSLYDSQSGLLLLSAGHERQMDAFKLTLGLPPDLDLGADDPLLKRFELIDPSLDATRKNVDVLLGRLRDPEQPMVGAKSAQTHRETLASIRQDVVDQLEAVHGDFQSLIRALPTRGEYLRKLSMRDEFQRGEVDPSVADVAALLLRVLEICDELQGGKAAGELSFLLLELYEELEGSEAARVAARRLVELFQELEGFEAAVELATRLNVDPPQPEDEEGRQQERRKAHVALSRQLTVTLAEIEQLEQVALPPPGPEADALREQMRDTFSRLADELLQLTLVQARARLDTIVLEPIETDAGSAVATARSHRRDWMNARADLVDAWRQIEVKADDLKSDLDVTFSGDLTTTSNTLAPTHNTTGNYQVKLEFDAPLTRLAERNAYREALIAYQQARRTYYAFEDEVTDGLRDTVRTIELNQLNFEVQRAAVLVAISQVDRARLRLKEPGSVQLGANAARNLVDALRTVLRNQNSLLRVWVNQEVQRMTLELDTGTMRLDQQGTRISPESVEAADAGPVDWPDQMPPPELIPAPPGEPLPGLLEMP